MKRIVTVVFLVFVLLFFPFVQPYPQLQDKPSYASDSFSDLLFESASAIICSEPLLLPPDPSPSLPSPRPQWPKGKTAYLTFDDGPSANTDRVLAILHQYNVKATFFVNGRSDPSNIQRYKDILKEGHAIGNHTYTHDYRICYASTDQFMADYQHLNELLYQTVGYIPSVMRFPGGSNNTVSWNYGGRYFMSQELIPLVLQKGYCYYDWNVSSGDANGTLLTKDQIIYNVKSGIGSKQTIVVLFHDASDKITTPDALPDIITYLQSQGFAFDILTPESPPCRFP